MQAAVLLFVLLALSPVRRRSDQTSSGGRTAAMTVMTAAADCDTLNAV